MRSVLSLSTRLAVSAPIPCRDSHNPRPDGSHCRCSTRAIDALGHPRCGSRCIRHSQRTSGPAPLDPFAPFPRSWPTGPGGRLYNRSFGVPKNPCFRHGRPGRNSSGRSWWPGCAQCRSGSRAGEFKGLDVHLVVEMGSTHKRVGHDIRQSLRSRNSGLTTSSSMRMLTSFIGPLVVSRILRFPSSEWQ